MDTSLKLKISKLVTNIKSSWQHQQQKKTARQKQKMLTKELVRTVKNPPENAVAKIAELVVAGADINTFDMDKERSLLHYAAEQNRMDLVNALMENGCKTYINVNDCYGKDPAFYAIDNNNGEMLDYLLANGVSTNRPADFNLDSSLRYAVCSGNVEMVKIELKHGADINDHVGESFKLYDQYQKTYPGPTPLAEIIGGQGKDGEIVSKKYDTEMIEFLLQNGARTDIKDSYGNDISRIDTSDKVKQLLQNQGKVADSVLNAALVKKAKTL